jgi:hypothetical protein
MRIHVNRRLKLPRVVSRDGTESLHRSEGLLDAYYSRFRMQSRSEESNTS